MAGREIPTSCMTAQNRSRPEYTNLQKTSVSLRLSAGLAANITGKLWVLLCQLCTIPFLVKAWGASGYGVWLMLTTIPTYIALCGLGFGAAAAVDMTQRVAHNDRAGAASVFQSVWCLITSISALIVLTAGVAWLSRGWIAHLFTYSHPERLISTACVMAIYSCAATQTSLVSLGYRSTGRYAVGTLLQDLLLPIETAAIISIASSGSSQLVAAGAMTAIRIFGTALYYLKLVQWEPWLRLGFREVRWNQIRRLAHPAFGVAGVMLASALSTQGLILAIGICFSPASVAIYSSARTLARAPLQLVGLASRAIAPELTFAHAQGNRALSSELVVISLSATMLCAIPVALLLSMFGPRLLGALSHHQLVSSSTFMAILSITIIFTSIWDTLSNLLQAIGKQHSIALAAMASAAATAASPYLARGHSIELLALFVAAAEGGMLAFTSWTWRGHMRMSLDEVQSATSRLVSKLQARGLRLIGRFS